MSAEKRKVEATVPVASVTATLDAIAANQAPFMRTRGLRKKYRLLLANEPLFAQLGIVQERMLMQRTPRGFGQRVIFWWLNRGLDTGDAPASPPPGSERSAAGGGDRHE